MYAGIVERFGAWRVFTAGCELGKVGFPPTWGTTKKQADDIEKAIESENVELLRLFC